MVLRPEADGTTDSGLRHRVRGILLHGLAFAGLSDFAPLGRRYRLLCLCA